VSQGDRDKLAADCRRGSWKAMVFVLIVYTWSVVVYCYNQSSGSDWSESCCTTARTKPAALPLTMSRDIVNRTPSKTCQ
jgi:hypothetical protein